MHKGFENGDGDKNSASPSPRRSPESRVIPFSRPPAAESEDTEGETAVPLGILAVRITARFARPRVTVYVAGRSREEEETGLPED